MYQNYQKLKSTKKWHVFDVFIKISKIRTVKARRWINPDLQYLICKCDAVHARYRRIGRATLLDKFRNLRRVIVERSEDARTFFLRDHIGIALNEGKGIWKELRHLGLLPKPNGA